jgi:hypothetical protein
MGLSFMVLLTRTLLNFNFFLQCCMHPVESTAASVTAVAEDHVVLPVLQGWSGDHSSG